MDVYLETGAKRTFAGAVDWPGWARSGRDADAALDALHAYGPRYAAALKGSRLGFRPPRSAEDLVVVRRVKGTATTDFGAPDVALPSDGDAIGDAELRRLHAILRVAWGTFDAAAAVAEGVELATGPRGGGRRLEQIVQHVLDADESYVRMIGRRASHDRDAGRDALEHAVRHGVEPGPRGGRRWVPRYFVRRSAWHVLDHAWEIQDRARG